MGRAVFKKGQKCLVPHTEITEPEVTRFYAALVRLAPRSPGYAEAGR